MSPRCRLYIVLCLAVEIIFLNDPTNPTSPTSPCMTIDCRTFTPLPHFYKQNWNTQTHTRKQTRCPTCLTPVLLVRCWHLTMDSHDPCMTTHAGGGFHNACENKMMCGLRHFDSDGSRAVIFAWSASRILCNSMTRNTQCHNLALYKPYYPIIIWKRWLHYAVCVLLRSICCHLFLHLHRLHSSQGFFFAFSQCRICKWA